mgnify:CR=1 FL=1
MTKREIALHLTLLMLLVLAGSGFYAYQKSSAMVPFLIRHLDSDSFRERQAATFRLQELGNAARAAAPCHHECTFSHEGRPAAAARMPHGEDLDAAVGFIDQVVDVVAAALQQDPAHPVDSPPPARFAKPRHARDPAARLS